jgi:hypothetical protein
MDDRSSQKWPASVCSSIASLHKNGFGLASLQHNSALTVLPWPQTILVFIDMKLVIHPQLPPKIWAPKMPNISQKWIKSSIDRLKISKKSKLYNKKPLCTKIWVQPLFLCTLGHMGTSMWLGTIPPDALSSLSGWLLVFGVGIGPGLTTLATSPILLVLTWLYGATREPRARPYPHTSCGRGHIW